MPKISNHKRILLAAALTCVVLVLVGTLTFLAFNRRDEARSPTAGGSIPIDATLPDQQDIVTNSPDFRNDPAHTSPKTISYEELFRNSDKHVGEFVRYEGKVIQVLGEPGSWNLRVNVTKKGSATYTYWEDTVLVVSYSKERLLEGDIIEFTGKSRGTTTYEAVLGQKITLPSLLIYEQKLIGRED